MDKSEAISIINKQLENLILHTSNTSYSKINVAKKVWWLNIPPAKFGSNLNLLLFDNYNKIIWIKIKSNSILNLNSIFKIRPDKNVVDLEISAEIGSLYLRDIKSGGTRFNFEPFVEKVYTI